MLDNGLGWRGGVETHPPCVKQHRSNKQSFFIELKCYDNPKGTDFQL